MKICFDISLFKVNINSEFVCKLFWEKRLEGLRACDVGGTELDAMELPRGLRAVGPHVREETLLQSVATALHVSAQPVTGQTGSRSALDKNPGVFLNPDQPLVQVFPQKKNIPSDRNANHIHTSQI
ncbi:hypothetical protein J437_LFUL007344 [Ladona fulva]|uniref:Methyl-CpG binding protein 2/3 C-terminal domain-containing protein n=1 Tax=Ladona fulva TaxID=123851 RepID=A0A8K0P825_LADFU|nr:hypothetical protein J437_LFUL007344 [Ladona fulva]